MDTMKLPTTPIRTPDHDFWYQDPEPLLAAWERSQKLDQIFFWIATPLAIAVPAIFFTTLGLMIGLNR
jgi:hypothetical protein